MIVENNLFKPSEKLILIVVIQIINSFYTYIHFTEDSKKFLISIGFYNVDLGIVDD